MASIQEMLTDSLRDMYDAERQALKAMPKMMRAATSQELKQALQEHIEVTKGQVARLEQVFESLGQRARAKSCKAMQGLVAEAMEHIQEHERGNELDAILVASAQKVEHYEIAAYGTARAMAKSAGQRDAANLLQETLREEEATDKLLTKVALNTYREMVREEGASEAGVEEEEQIAGRGRRGGRGASTGGRKAAGGRGASKKKVGTQRSLSRSASKRAAAGSDGSSAGSHVTTDHEEIRHWAEDRGAEPACVRGTGTRGDIGMLRLDFPGYTGDDSLEHITWDQFFEKFDEQGLALLYQDKTARGQRSNFNKLVSRETAEEVGSGGRGGSARRGAR